MTRLRTSGQSKPVSNVFTLTKICGNGSFLNRLILVSPIIRPEARNHEIGGRVSVRKPTKTLTFHCSAAIRHSAFARRLLKQPSEAFFLYQLGFFDTEFS